MQMTVGYEALLACPHRATQLLGGGYPYHGFVLPDPRMPETGVLFLFPVGVNALCLAQALVEEDLPVADPCFQERVFAALRGKPGPTVVRYLREWEKRSVN